MNNVIESSSCIRQIETAMSNVEKNLCINFYSLKQSVWISVEEYICAGSDMTDFLENSCELERGVAEFIVAHDYIPVEATGLAKLCLSSHSFDFAKYSEIMELLEHFDEEVIEAGIELGVEICNIEEQYRGEYSTFKDFCVEIFDELSLHEIPECYHQYIDYNKVEADMELEGNYLNFNGHIFYANS